MELISALAQTFDHCHGIIAGVRPDQLTDPTPCSEWDVHDLLSHTLEVVASWRTQPFGSGHSRGRCSGCDPVTASCRAMRSTTFRVAKSAWCSSW
jgi:hypothetical protein